MDKLILFIITIILILNSAVIHFARKSSHKDCYAKNKKPYVLFGSKTAYSFIHGYDYTRIKTCEAIHFWSMNRHGTRLPSKTGIKNMKKLKKMRLEILRTYINHNFTGQMCNEDYIMIAKWKWNNEIRQKIASYLTAQGWNDMKYIAQRYKIRFPELFGTSYMTYKYLFRSTNTERTLSSCKAYKEGLFGKEVYIINDDIRTDDADYVLQAYRDCKLWNLANEDSETSNEYQKFMLSKTYKKMLHEVSKRLGYNYTLGYLTIKTVYDMCRYEQAWYIDKPSTWCASFRKYDLQILEYAEDLLNFYKMGPGNIINGKIGCTPLKDMMERFIAIVHGNYSEPRIVIYFTHNTALQLFLTALNINHNVIPLKADNMEKQYSRFWRLSFMGPFASNFVAVLLRCDTGEKYRVIFYLNEKKIFYPGCIEGICPWHYIHKLFGNVLFTCNRNICNAPSNNNSTQDGPSYNNSTQNVSSYNNSTDDETEFK